MYGGGKVSIDYVIINLRGEPDNIYASNGTQINLTKLANKEIDTLLLLSCNTGNIDY